MSGKGLNPIPQQLKSCLVEYNKPWKLKLCTIISIGRCYREADVDNTNKKVASSVDTVSL